MIHKFLAGAGLLVLAGWGVSGLAVAGSDIKQVDLTLRILVDGPPPCSVKGSAVEFGNVVINRIDGTNYQQDAKYTLNCGNKVSDDLRMQLKGNTAVINGETVLSTDIAGLPWTSSAPVRLPLGVIYRAGATCGGFRGS